MVGAGFYFFDYQNELWILYIVQTEETSPKLLQQTRGCSRSAQLSPNYEFMNEQKILSQKKTMAKTPSATKITRAKFCDMGFFFLKIKFS